MDINTVTVGWTPTQTMQHPHHQPPVNIRTPYNPNCDWAFPSCAVQDAETQTIPLQDTVREVLVNMVLTRLQTKGLPLVACPHTKGLQLDNIVNGIVDSHSITCTTQSHQQQQSFQQQQQQIYQPGPQQQNIVHLFHQQNHQQDFNSNIQDGMTQFFSHDESSSSVPKVQDENKPIKTSSEQRKRSSNSSGTLTSPMTPKRRKPLSFVHKCDKCDKTFETNRLLQRHLTVHSQNRPYKCEKCDYSFKSEYECTRHFRRVHLHKYPFHCMTCGKGYDSKHKLVEHETDTHLKVPDKDKPFICKHCNKGFLLNRLLNDHLAYHEKDKQFKCDLCPHRSGNRKTRRRHINQTHKVFSSRISNKCLVCDLELHEYHILIEHMKQNHEIAGIKCKDCGAMLKNNSMLKMHMKKEHQTEQMKLEESKGNIQILKGIIHHKTKGTTTQKKKKNKYDILTASLEKRSKVLQKMVNASLDDHESIGDSEGEFLEETEGKPGSSRTHKKKKKKTSKDEVSISLDYKEDVFFKCRICGGLYMNRLKLSHHLKLHNVNVKSGKLSKSKKAPRQHPDHLDIDKSDILNHRTRSGSFEEKDKTRLTQSTDLKNKTQISKSVEHKGKAHLSQSLIPKNIPQSQLTKQEIKNGLLNLVSQLAKLDHKNASQLSLQEDQTSSQSVIHSMTGQSQKYQSSDPLVTGQSKKD